MKNETNQVTVSSLAQELFSLYLDSLEEVAREAVEEGDYETQEEALEEVDFHGFTLETELWEIEEEVEQNPEWLSLPVAEVFHLQLAQQYSGC